MNRSSLSLTCAARLICCYPVKRSILPRVFGANLILQIIVTFFLPFLAGWMIFTASRWLSSSEVGYKVTHQRSVISEAVSTCWVLVGVYPTVNILIGRALGRWSAPFGFDLSYPPLWGVLSLAVLAGTLLTFPFHLWMIRRGEIHWGAANPADGNTARKLRWVLQILILVVSLAAMLAAIFLSMQIA